MAAQYVRDVTLRALPTFNLEFVGFVCVLALEKVCRDWLVYMRIKFVSD